MSKLIPDWIEEVVETTKRLGGPSCDEEAALLALHKTLSQMVHQDNVLDDSGLYSEECVYRDTYMLVEEN